MKTLVSDISLGKRNFLLDKLADYAQLVKVNLTLVVVFSAAMGYVIASKGDFVLINFLILVFGGFLTTSSGNALNQVLEKDFDIHMTRTANRPVASGRMKSSEAVMFAGIACLIGISLLASFNPLTGLLGMLSLIIYSFIYTPLKRYSTLAVPVGAVPGALPVMIGFTAFENGISMLALSLFVIQFLWQFPHFWAIGFNSYGEYQKAGYKLLPEVHGSIDRNLGLTSFFYSLLIFPVIVFIYLRLDGSLIGFVLMLLISVIYSLLSFDFHLKFNRPSALKLMFYSFLFLPATLFIYWLS